jgi:ADP-heptose:LPS heptosyltransferase
MSGTPQRILIIRRRAIGDCIVSMDVARALREHWPQAHIVFVVDGPGADVVQDSPFVDEVMVYDRREHSTGPIHRRLAATWRWFSRLRSMRADLVLDLLGTPQTAVWTAWTAAAKRVGPRRRNRTWAYNVHVEREVEKRFAGERFLDWVRALGFDPGPWRPHPPVTAQRVLEGLEAQTRDRPLVVLNASATWTSKAWPEESFAEVGRRLAKSCDVRFAWAPNEEALRDRIVAAAPGAIEPLPPTTLAELGAWLARAAVVVTTDSGPKHLAVAMGTRTVTVFGSTDPRGWQPPGDAHRALTNPVDCHPCDLRECVVDGHPCLDQLDPAVVASEVEAMLFGGEVHG